MPTIVKYWLTQEATLSLGCTFELALFLAYVDHSWKTFDCVDVCEFLFSELYRGLLDLLDAWWETADSSF